MPEVKRFYALTAEEKEKQVGARAKTQEMDGLSPLEEIHLAQEILPELEKIRQNQIVLEGKMNILGKAFRDMGVMRALLNGVKKILREAAEEYGEKDRDETTRLWYTKGDFQRYKAIIEKVNNISKKIASEPEEGFHFELDIEKGNESVVKLYKVDDKKKRKEVVMMKRDENSDEEGFPLRIDLTDFPWDDSTPEGIELLHAIEEAFPKSAQYIRYPEKMKQEEKEEEERAKQEADRLKKEKNEKVLARIAKLQKEISS